ncbi:ATP/GTP-binding protein [uncultured Eubacterium sp.]|uniref:AAA family ATPase n=1 Tax=uncultured Eubacterium sp. TaxID=165185 RepID=UPI0025917E51|nr:ATP-binding protein [uncultured Eubacterium sp.]
MLLEFRTKNYKSFVDEMVFSMTPAPKQKGLDYSILSEKVGRKNYKGICSAVVYGPNAAGKTNMIGAMETFRSIVLRGNIKNDIVSSPNVASANLEMIPNCKKGNGYTEFSIKFVDEILVEYYIKIDLGPFLEASYSRKILEEKLVINEKQIFYRNNKLAINLSTEIKKYVNKSINRNTPKMIEMAEASLSDTELFLNNGFKSIYAQELVNRILEWFSNKFMVVYSSNSIRLVKEMTNLKINEFYTEDLLTDVAREFGITGSELGYKTIKTDNLEGVALFSKLGDKAILANYFESYGTIRFINEFPLIIAALKSGGTVVMDEFDASIHPMALMNIINIFHNDDINIKNAQLIFNTHNPIFLDASLFRRDEIKFVERDEISGESIHYALSDFKTAKNGVRKGEDYMNNYFVSRYGAIRDVDFEPIIENVVLGSVEAINNGKT